MTKDRTDATSTPNEIVSRPETEIPGKEGTLGGAAPLDARPGVQSARKDGVLDVVNNAGGATEKREERAGGPAPAHPSKTE